MASKIDILAIGAHPDDIELGCGGTILNQVYRGKKVGLIDLTAGELGKRGSLANRKQESNKASKILRLDFRLNLRKRDGFNKNEVHITGESSKKLGFFEKFFNFFN